MEITFFPFSQTWCEKHAEPTNPKNVTQSQGISQSNVRSLSPGPHTHTRIHTHTHTRTLTHSLTHSLTHTHTRTHTQMQVSSRVLMPYLLIYFSPAPPSFSKQTIPWIPASVIEHRNVPTTCDLCGKSFQRGAVAFPYKDALDLTSSELTAHAWFCVPPVWVPEVFYVSISVDIFQTQRDCAMSRTRCPNIEAGRFFLRLLMLKKNHRLMS